MRSHGGFSYKFRTKPTDKCPQHNEWNFRFYKSFNWKFYGYSVAGLLILFIICTVQESISAINSAKVNTGYTYNLVMNLHNIFEISLLTSLFFANGISSKKLRKLLKAIRIMNIKPIEKKAEIFVCLRKILLMFFVQKLFHIIGFLIFTSLSPDFSPLRELINHALFAELEISFSLFYSAAFELMSASYSGAFNTLVAFNETRTTIFESTFERVDSQKLTEMKTKNLHAGDHELRTHQLLVAVRSANYRLMQIYSVRVRLQSFIGQAIAAILLHVVIGVILGLFAFSIVTTVGEHIEYVVYVLPNFFLLFFVVYIPSLVEPKVSCINLYLPLINIILYF